MESRETRCSKTGTSLGDWGLEKAVRNEARWAENVRFFFFFLSLFFLEYFFFFLKENLGNNALELVYKSNEICRNERDSCASFRIRRKMTKALAFP